MFPFIKKLNNKQYLLLIFIYLIGLTLRLINLKDVFFVGFDQARDLTEIFYMVLQKHPKIVGPGTDIPGLFSGPFFYYLLLPGYYLFNFNLNSAAVLVTLFNTIGILLLYYLGKQFYNQKTGFIAALFWAVSYEQMNFSRFISNAAFIPIWSIIFFLGLFIFFIKRKDFGLIISSIGYGLAIQFDMYLIYLGIFYLIFFFFFPRKINKKVCLTSMGILVFFLASFLIAEIKFNFMGLKSLLLYLSHQHKDVNIINSVKSYFYSFSRTIYFSFLGVNNLFAFLLFTFFVVLIYLKEKLSKRNIFIFTWLLSTAPLFIFKSNVVGGSYIHSSIVGATTLASAYAITLIFEKKRFLGSALIITIIISNFLLLSRKNFQAQEILAYQPMVYKDQKALIDYTYNSSEEKIFSICSLSNPLFVNTLWSTLYKIYGEKKYGYLPYWSGPEQTLYKSFLPIDYKHVSTRYLIIEPSNQLPKYAIETTIYLENKVSNIIETKKFNELIVQKRILKTNKKIQNKSTVYNQETINAINQIIKTDYRYSCFMNY